MKKLKPNLLTLKDTINILSMYDIEHCRFPHNYIADVVDDIPRLNGLVLGDKRLILIDREQPIELAKEVVIHELLHCKHYELGDLSGFNRIENYIKQETDLTYKLLYGHKP